MSGEYDFVNAPPAPLFCPICQDLFQRPVITKECGHSFCKTCLAQAIHIDSSCPLCRKHIEKEDDALPNLVLEAIVGEVLVKCRRNCGWSGQLQCLASHEDSSCPNRPVPCSGVDLGCRWNGPSSLLEPHLAVCPHLLLREFITSTRTEIASLKSQMYEYAKEIELLQNQLKLVDVHTSTSLASSSTSSCLSPSTTTQSTIETIGPIGVQLQQPQAAAMEEPVSAKFKAAVVNTQCTKTLVGHAYGVTALAFDGKFLYTGSHDTKVKVWDAAAEYQLVAELDGHDATIWSIFVSNGLIFTASADFSVREWQIEPQGAGLVTTHRRTFKSPLKTKVYSVIFNGTHIVGSSYKSIFVWDYRSGELVRTLAAHDEAVWTLKLFEGKLFSCSEDGTIVIWDMASFQKLKTLQVPDAHFVSLAVGNGFIFAGAEDSKIHIWSLSSFEHVGSLAGHSWAVWQLALHPAGFLFSASFDHTIKCWELPLRGEGEIQCVYSMKAHQGNIYAMVVAAESNTIFTGSADRSAKVWRIPFQVHPRLGATTKL